MAVYYDENNKDQYQLTKSDFTLVQKDRKISDQKFQTKPTTFFKDCLRRFMKNKSSVVGAFILGTIILLAIFLPIFSPKNITEAAPAESFLAPKLFKAGTGFWDGCVKYEHLVYDKKNEVPADMYKPAVLDLKVDENPTYVNQASTYATGGYFNFINDGSKEVVYLNSDTATFLASGNYKVIIKFGTEDDLFARKLGEYRILLADASSKQSVELKPYSKDYSDLTLDISKALTASGIEKIEKGRLTFELKSSNNDPSYILIQSCVFSCDPNQSSDATFNEKNKEDLAKISINDATESILYAVKDNVAPKGYWTSNGIKNIYKSEIYYCSFRYDTYAVAYDVQKKTVAISDLNAYIKNGWCSYDKNVGPSSFKKLSDECPIEKVHSQNTDRVGNLSSVEADVCRYKEMGYSSMPTYFLGTDQAGHDLVKKVFNGLRISLILGLCTAAFCLLFGLCWGAISGYFGGNIDLAMERFCDILGGVPTTIVLTLCILHLGNNFGTFFLALCLTGWMGTAARTRTQFYRFKGREYVLASRTLGASDWRLIFKHILPNSLGTIVTGAVLMIPSVIYSEATLAYLNLGLQGLGSFGVILSDNQAYISTHPTLIAFPSVIMALMMISFNLFGNGLRDALNPSLKGSE